MIFLVNMLFKVEIVKLTDVFTFLIFRVGPSLPAAAGAIAAGNTLDFPVLKISKIVAL